MTVVKLNMLFYMSMLFLYDNVNFEFQFHWVLNIKNKNRHDLEASSGWQTNPKWLWRQSNDSDYNDVVKIVITNK